MRIVDGLVIFYNILVFLLMPLFPLTDYLMNKHLSIKKKMKKKKKKKKVA